MKLLTNTILPLGSAFFALSASSVQAAVYSYGHADIGVEYVSAAEAAEEGETPGLHLHFHAHSGAVVDGSPLTADGEYEPGEVTILVPSSTRRDLSSSPGLSAAFGSSAYILSASSTVAAADGAPFLGWGTEELDAGDWSGNITLTLADAVSSSGAGAFGVYTFDDVTGSLIWLLSSWDESNRLELVPGSHSHYYVAFSEPGDWDITLTASGTHGQDGFVSSTETYRFQVVPEPSSALLGLIGAVALWRRRR